MGNLTDRKPGRKPPQRILLTDDARLPDPRPAVAALAPGSAVILRHYDAPDRAGLARALLALCRPRRISLLVAADPGLALAVGADGLHLPESLLFSPSHSRWRRLPPGMLISAAAHSPRAIRRARGVDFVLLSPVFPTLSHPDARPIGVSRFAAWVGRAGVPVYALGGVGESQERRLLAAGAAGWAAIGGLSGPNGGI